MLRSLHMKLVMLMVLLILSLMTDVGAFSSTLWWPFTSRTFTAR